CDHTATTPELCHVWQIEVVLIKLGISKWCRLGINSLFLLADIRRVQHTHTLSVRGHDSVLDSVVDHLHEMAGAVRTTMEIALIGSSCALSSSRRRRDITDSRREGREDWIEMSNHLRLAANHHAVASLQPPHTATRANVDVMNALRRQFFGAPNVVDVIRIPTVDENVFCIEQWQKIFDSLTHYGSRNHQPDHTRRIKSLYKIRQRAGAGGVLFDQLAYSNLRPVEHHATVAIPY